MTLIQIIAAVGGFRVVLKSLTEVAVLLADACGKSKSPAAKKVGEAAWWVGKFSAAIGGGTSDRYLKKRFVVRPAKEVEK